MKNVNARALSGLETKSAGQDQPDVVKAVADLQAAFETKMAKLETDVKAAGDRADALETQLARPGIITGAKSVEEIENKALNDWARGVQSDEVKTLQITGSGNTGGVVVPQSFVTTVINKLIEIAPVRSLANVITIGGTEAEIPRLKTSAGAGIVTETAARPETEPEFELVKIPTFEIARQIPVSRQLLEDSAVDLSSFLAEHIGQVFGQVEANYVIAGQGTTEPQGFVGEADVTEVAGGHASLLTGDGLIDLVYSLPPGYRARASFMMRGTSIASVRKLKGSDGHYLWQDPLAAGQPATLLGFPVYEAEPVPAVAANANAVFFGDWRSALTIVDRVNFSMLRDDFTGAGSGVVKFHVRRRMGSRLTQPAALRKIKIATSV